MSARRLANPDHIKNFFLCNILLFLAGSLTSLGIFNSAVEKSAHPPGSFNGVWSSSMCLISIFCVPFTLVAGVFLSNARSHPIDDASPTATTIHDKIRLFCSFGSFPYALLGLSPLGIAWQNAYFLQFLVALQAIPLGIHYVICLEILGACSHSRPGLLIGTGQLAFGLGGLAFASFFHSLLENFDINAVFRIAAAILFLPSLLFSVFLSWPQHDHLSTKVAEAPFTQETHQLVGTRDSSLSWKKLLRLQTFWFYIVTIMAAQAGYAFYPYFFKIGMAFGFPEAAVVNYFQIVLFISTILRPLGGVMSDSLRWGNGWFSVGPRNTMAVLLLFQVFMLVGLIWASYNMYFYGFVAATAGVLFVFSAGACGPALLAREMFGAENSSLVFGMGGGVAMGMGEFLSGELMAIVDWSHNESSGPSKYNQFYAVSIVSSLIGLVCCAMMRTYGGERPRVHFLTMVESLYEHGSEDITNRHYGEGYPEYGAVTVPAIECRPSNVVEPSESRCKGRFDWEHV